MHIATRTHTTQTWANKSCLHGNARVCVEVNIFSLLSSYFFFYSHFFLFVLYPYICGTDNGVMHTAHSQRHIHMSVFVCVCVAWWKDEATITTTTKREKKGIKYINSYQFKAVAHIFCCYLCALRAWCATSRIFSLCVGRNVFLGGALHSAFRRQWRIHSDACRIPLPR